MSKQFIESHQWAEIEGTMATVGISNFAADELGEVTYVELPSVGKVLKAGEAYGSIESVKAANELFTPIAGRVAEVNTELETNPGLVNESAQDKGWIVKLDTLGESLKGMTEEEYLACLPKK